MKKTFFILLLIASTTPLISEEETYYYCSITFVESLNGFYGRLSVLDSSTDFEKIKQTTKFQKSMDSMLDSMFESIGVNQKTFSFWTDELYVLWKPPDTNQYDTCYVYKFSYVESTLKGEIVFILKFPCYDLNDLQEKLEEQTPSGVKNILFWTDEGIGRIGPIIRKQ